MKTILKITALSAVLLILAGGLVSCNETPCTTVYTEPHLLERFPLAGTMWKLTHVNFRDGDGRYLLVLEPEDCDMCFTLVFDSDTTALGISITNQVTVRWPNIGYVYKKYGLDRYLYYKSKLPKNLHGGTAIITVEDNHEPYDGDLYSTLLRRVHSIIVHPNLQYLVINSVERLGYEVVLGGITVPVTRTSVLHYKRRNP